jgi:hypothetical protein
LEPTFGIDKDGVLCIFAQVKALLDRLGRLIDGQLGVMRFDVKVSLLLQSSSGSP